MTLLLALALVLAGAAPAAADPVSGTIAAFLATTGATAPFVGLFGTTFGIINAFSGMAMTGSGGIAAISAGIAEALITTALGLVVAIVAVWAYNYFAGQVDGFTVEMDNSGSELLDFVKKSA